MDPAEAPDAAAVAAPPDTPAAGPGSDGTPGDVDYEKRYNDLRPQFDRTTQELAAAKEAAQAWQRFQQSPEEVLRELGYDVETGDEPDPYEPTGFEDPRLTAALRELEQVKQTVGGMTEAQQQAAQEQALRSSIDEQFAALPQGLDESDENWIASRAATLPARPDGTPDIAAAHAEYQALQTQLQKRWADTKTTSRGPLQGKEGNHDPFPEDLTGQALVNAMVERVNALSGAS